MALKAAPFLVITGHQLVFYVERTTINFILCHFKSNPKIEYQKSNSGSNQYEYEYIPTYCFYSLFTFIIS